MVATNEKVSDASFRKIQAQIRDAVICMITTNALEWSLKQEALHNQWMDNNGDIWFILYQEDQHIGLNVNQEMEVFYSNVSQSQFLSLVGMARLVDRAHLPAAIFQHRKNESSSDDSCSYIRFTPREAFYWDDCVENMESLPLSGEGYHVYHQR